MTVSCRTDEHTKPTALRAAARSINAALSDLDPGTRLVNPDDIGLGTTPMPVEALSVIAEVLTKMARGDTVGLMVLDDPNTLTTQQAADMLGVSRPHLVQLLANEHIPHHRGGPSPRAHRRIDRQAIIDLKARRERGMRTMDELMVVSEEVAD